MKVPNDFAVLGYDSDSEAKMEEFELEDHVKVYLPASETKEEKKEKKKKSRASRGG